MTMPPICKLLDETQSLKTDVSKCQIGHLQICTFCIDIIRIEVTLIWDLCSWIYLGGGEGGGAEHWENCRDDMN